MGYEIEFSHKAAKQFADLETEAQRRLRPRIDALAEDPRPNGCKKLTDMKGAYRIRVGDFRVVYTVDDEIEVVGIARVGDRASVYRGL